SFSGWQRKSRDARRACRKSGSRELDAGVPPASFPRMRESSFQIKSSWIPAFAGMTNSRIPMTKTHEALVNAARQARGQARAKYSNFKVGSALLCGDGRVFTGCNIESSSYGLTICSERVALFKALSEGANNFVRIVVVADTNELTAPCGACRQ